MSVEREPQPAEDTFNHISELAKNQYAICRYRHWNDGSEKTIATDDMEELASMLAARDLGWLAIDQVYLTEFDFDQTL